MTRQPPPGNGWYPVAWQSEDRVLPVRIERTTSNRYDGERFAVRCGIWCLTLDGDWECEPIPSSRDEVFDGRCRFPSLDAAIAAAAKAGRA